MNKTFSLTFKKCKINIVLMLFKEAVIDKNIFIESLSLYLVTIFSFFRYRIHIIHIFVTFSNNVSKVR